MSTRTIIEVNHDYLHDLLKYPEEVQAFIAALKSSSSWAEAHTPSGIRILGQRHHSETLKLTVK